MITVKNILERYDLGTKMAEILESLGMDTIKHGITYSTKPEHMNPVIVDEQSLKEHLWSISKAEIASNYVTSSRGATPSYVTLWIHLHGHDGTPGGESGKYLGNIKLEIEEIAFVMLMAKYL